MVENQLVKSVLNKQGYETTIQDLSVPVAANGLSTGQIDVYIGNWWPSQKGPFQKLIEAARFRIGISPVAGTVTGGQP